MPDTTQSKSPRPKLSKKGWVFVIFGLLFLIGVMSDGPKATKSDNGTVTAHTKILSTDNMRSATDKVLSDIYDVVHDNPDAQIIEQKVTINRYGISDQYGNPLEEDLNMGTLTWPRTEIEEIQKFQKDYVFTQNDTYVGIAMARLSLMNGANLLQ